MNPKAPWLAAILLLCPLGAQDDPAKPSVDAATRLQQLEAEQQQVLADWREQMRAAAEARKANPDQKKARAIAMRPDYGSLRAKYMAAADRYGDDAPKFLIPALNVSSKPAQYKEIFDRIVTSHLDSDDVSVLGGRLKHLNRMVDADYQASVIARIEKHGNNAGLLAWIAFGRHEDTFRTQNPKTEAFQSAKKIVAAALEKGGDSVLHRQFDQLIAEQENFGMGMEAPDIVGVDLDGVEFKLSDYRGKVVFLDFWGDW